MAASYLWCVLATHLPRAVPCSPLAMLLVKLVLEQLTLQISSIWSLGATVLQLKLVLPPSLSSAIGYTANNCKKGSLSEKERK